MKRYVTILNIIIRLGLGFVLIDGSIKKFKSEIPPATVWIDQAHDANYQNMDETHLKIKNYIVGMKQTNYFWQFLGLAELLCGILLVSQILGFIGAITAVPITLNIFLFHLYLEPHEIGELIQTGLFFIGNCWLIAFEYKNWKPLIKTKFW